MHDKHPAIHTNRRASEGVCGHTVMFFLSRKFSPQVIAHQ